MQTQIQTDNQSVREQIYRGELFLLLATDASRALASTVWSELEHEFADVGPVREVQFYCSDDEFFEHVGRLRKRFYTSPLYHDMLTSLIHGLGFNAAEHAFDPIRLRVIPHDGHQRIAARPMYYSHRDTWYSNPQSMITWWIPLHDVCPEETFEFFPDEFERPVSNDSEIFDFDAWVADGQKRRIGWQDKRTGLEAGYPHLMEEPRGDRIPVACSAGDTLLFSAQHLHQTRPNTTGQTRFSIDFRTVHLTDHAAGIAPRNVDNRSTGSSLMQFVHPETLKHQRGPA